MKVPKVKEVVFFLMMFFLFFLMTKFAHYMNKKVNMNNNLQLVLVSLLYTLLVASVYYLASINSVIDNYRMLEISPAAKCSLGPGFVDEKTAKECQKLAQTPEGRAELASYSCPRGQYGRDYAPFEYTNLSNNCWQNDAAK